MISAETRAVFEGMTASGAGDAGALALGLRLQITGLGLRALAAKGLHATLYAPERLADIYENAAAGWLSRPVSRPLGPRMVPTPAPASLAFWRAFWELMETPTESRRKVTFTEQMARLAGLIPASLNDQVARAALDYPGVRDAAAGSLPGHFDLGELVRCPFNSLGGEYYRELLRDGTAMELIERERLGLADLPPPLDYLNTRILQCHALWRIVAGHNRGTGLDEISLAAFQMAQFGHQYSALFIGVVLTTLSIERPPGLEIVLDAIFKGYVHGRETPPLLGVAWENVWHLPVETVRTRLGVTALGSAAWPRTPTPTPTDPARRRLH